MALADKGLLVIERCFRALKTTQIKMRPMFHWKLERIVTHVKIWVLALLIERLAELKTGRPWQRLHDALATIQATEFRAEGQRVIHCSHPSEVAAQGSSGRGTAWRGDRLGVGTRHFPTVCVGLWPLVRFSDPPCLRVRNPGCRQSDVFDSLEEVETSSFHPSTGRCRVVGTRHHRRCGLAPRDQRGDYAQKMLAATHALSAAEPAS